jgi:hypothetical protein
MFDKSFKSAKLFDSNKLVQVSEEKGIYYLIDEKGNKVSDAYSEIVLKDKFYMVKSDSKKGILDSEGKEIVFGDYSNITIDSTNNDSFAVLETTDKKYEVYNLSTKKQVMSSDNKVSVQKHYMIVTVDGKKEYYTFSGKKFY